MNRDFQTSELVFELIGFSLNECLVDVEDGSAKYLAAVHRTALQIAVQNLFGTEIGGFWLTTEQINQLRKLPEYYSPNEAPQVAEVVEAYLRAQLSSCAGQSDKLQFVANSIAKNHGNNRQPSSDCANSRNQ